MLAHWFVIIWRDVSWYREVVDARKVGGVAGLNENVCIEVGIGDVVQGGDKLDDLIWR